MSDASSRFQIYEGQPPLPPGVCVICNSYGGDGRKFIDIGLQVKKLGRVYFCSFCWEEGCNELGWVSPANAHVISSKLTATEEELNLFKEQNAKLRDLAAGSIDKLRTDLVDLKLIPDKTNGTVKRGPGRPKKTEPGIAE